MNKKKFFIIQNGEPVEIKRSSSLKVKLTKEQKEKMRQMRKHRKGSIFLKYVIDDLYAPYKEFIEKVKAQVKQRVKQSG